MEIRKAESGDLSYLVESTIQLELHERRDSATRLRIAPNFRESLQDWLRAAIEQDNMLVLLAEEEGQPAGFTLAYIAPQPNGFTIFRSHGVIQILWTDPKHRRKGIAAQLLSAVEACFVELSIPYAEITYAANNESARAFWTAQGFQPDSLTCRKFYSTDAEGSLSSADN